MGKKRNFGYIPSIYQNDIYDEIEFGKDSMSINAVAGSGKTTTIVSSLELINSSLDVIFLAFNKSIVKALSERVPKHVAVSTLHSYGCRMLFMNYGGKLQISENKVFNLGCKMFDRWQVKGEKKYPYVARVSKIVDFMKFNIIEKDVDAITEMCTKYGINVFDTEVEHAVELLASSNAHSYDIIDFADMIYLPAVRNIKLKKYNYIFVDEAQDLNKAQQTMIGKMFPVRGIARLISVGDPRQSIYMFAGADSDSFDNMARIRPNTKLMPLSVCYRLTKELVRHAQEIVPHIQYHEGAAEGVPPRMGSINEIDEKSFVLCRNTKPLIVLFMILIKRGLKAQIKGKEIGQNIINIIQKTNQKTIERLMKHLEVHRVTLKKKLIDKGVQKVENHEQMIDYNEKVEIIRILGERFTTTGQLIKYIEKIFVDEDISGAMLSTIHRVKGLENDRVFMLSPELIPSQYATTEEAIQQEYNLLYVARTRAKKELIYIEDFPG